MSLSRRKFIALGAGTILAGGYTFTELISDEHSRFSWEQKIIIVPLQSLLSDKLTEYNASIRIDIADVKILSAEDDTLFELVIVCGDTKKRLTFNKSMGDDKITNEILKSCGITPKTYTRPRPKFKKDRVY